MIRSISTIAVDIMRDWQSIGNGVSYSAKHYLNAMVNLDRITDQYYNDTGRSVVSYFLANAGTYRGEKAKALKAELRELLK